MIRARAFSGSCAVSQPDATVVNDRTVAHGLPDGWAQFGVGDSDAA